MTTNLHLERIIARVEDCQRDCPGGHNNLSGRLSAIRESLRSMRALTPSPIEIPENGIVALANKHEGCDPEAKAEISISDLRAAAMAVNRLALAPLFERGKSSSPIERDKVLELLASKLPYDVFDYQRPRDEDWGESDQPQTCYMVSTLAIPQHPVALCGPDRAFAYALCSLLNRVKSTPSGGMDK